MDENYYYEDFHIPTENEMKALMRKEAVESAYKGYDLLTKNGKDALCNMPREKCVSSIKKIWGIMLQEEEYERCNFLRSFLIKELGVLNPKPIFADF